MILVCQLVTGPTPLGANPLTEALWQGEARQIHAAMIAKGYTQLAADWDAFYPSFHSKYPKYSPSQALSVFVGTEAAQGIAGATAQTGGLLGQIPGAAAKGAENVYANPLTAIGTFFGNLMNPNTWLRVAEVLAGLMILYVALKASMTPGGVPVASRKASHTFKDSSKWVAKKVIFK